MEPEAVIEVLVASKQLIAEDVVSVRFVPLCGGELPVFTPGAHIDVHLGPELVRQYSLAGSMRCRQSYEIAVLREPRSGGGSRYIHECLQEGQTVRIGAPRNHFGLDGSAQRSVLLAGGIGVTPIFCMADYLHGTGAYFRLHYFVRSASRAAFKERLMADDLAQCVRFHFDDGRGAASSGLREAIAPFQTGSHLYVCGPAGFIEAALATAETLGWPEASLHREYFARPADPASTVAQTGFTIHLARSRKTLYVPPEKTIVEVLTEAGIEVAVSCSQGICGTCLTRVLEGEPDHRDSVLTDEEHERNDQMTPCCSRARTAALVLDM